MPASRTILSVALVMPLTLFACDKKDEAKAKQDDKADKSEDKAEAKAEEAKAEPEEKKLEHPWRSDEVSGAMKSGTTLTYKQTGKDAKGKEVEDDYKCVVKKASAAEVGTVCNGVNHPSKDKGANEIATVAWTMYSPFFTVERPEVELVERAECTVPAGTFDCVQAKLTGVFGNNYTVWMIADKPGVYAKVQKHANTTQEDDQTDMSFELASIEGME